MNKSDLHPPTLSKALERIKELESLLMEVKSQYISYINEDAERSKTHSTIRLSHPRREYCLKIGSGSITRGINKCIDDHMLVQAAREDFK